MAASSPGILTTRENLDALFLAVRFGATARDWEELADDSHFVELVDGMLIVHSPAGRLHARQFGFLHPLLSMYVAARNLGEVFAGPYATDVSEDRKLEPDIFFRSAQSSSVVEEDRLRGPADFIIEIASPSTRNYDRRVKRTCYADAGVREYWMVDGHERRVVVDRPAGTEVLTLASGRLESHACRGFWIHVEWLWQSPLPNEYETLKRILGEAAPAQ
jgi:Uma2 family endonuclease